jgi:hypothetical protein
MPSGGKISEAQIYGLTIRESANDGSDFTNPAADFRRVFLGEDGEWHSKDSAGSVAGFAGSGISATLADAAGDTLVASGADAWARLALGAAGGRYSRINGAVAWNAGTSFPTAATGDIYHRTDLTPAEWRYDGTRWRCTCVHTVAAGVYDTTAASIVLPATIFDVAGLDVWAIDAPCGSALTSGTHNGSNHYTVDVYKMNAAGSGGTGSAIVSTTTHTIGTGTNNLQSLPLAIGAVVDVSATPAIVFILGEVGTAGSLRFWGSFRFQYIAT